MTSNSSKEKSLVQEAKQEFMAIKPLLPNGWPLLLIERFYSKLKGGEAIRKYIRITNIRDGNVAPTREEFRKISQLQKGDQDTVSKE